MTLADIYCLVCNKVDGQVEVESGDTFLIVHKDCAGSHKDWMDRSLSAEKLEYSGDNGCERNPLGQFKPK